VTYNADGTRAPAYPLQLVLDRGPVLLRATDATGRQVSCAYKRDSGPDHATVYEDESLRRVRFVLRDAAPDRRRFLEDLGRERRPLRDLTGPNLAGPDPPKHLSGVPGYVIVGPGGGLLGRLSSPAGAWEVIWHGAYDVADASGWNVGRILRDDPLRPARRVELRGAPVMRLRRQSPPRNGYGLEKTGAIPEREEELLLAAVVAVVLIDWWRNHAG